MEKLKDKVKQDEVYLRYRNILKTVRTAVSIESVLKEGKFLHKSRKSRVLFEARVSPQKLQDALLNDMSNRSRLTELKVLLMNQQELLSTTITIGKKHVRSQYADLVQRYGSTKEAQLLVVDRIFASGNEVLAEIDNAVDILDLYIKDIDNAGYALRNVTETLRMVLDRKETVS